MTPTAWDIYQNQIGCTVFAHNINQRVCAHGTEADIVGMSYLLQCHAVSKPGSEVRNCLNQLGAACNKWLQAHWICCGTAVDANCSSGPTPDQVTGTTDMSWYHLDWVSSLSDFLQSTADSGPSIAGEPGPVTDETFETAATKMIEFLTETFHITSPNAALPEDASEMLSTMLKNLTSTHLGVSTRCAMQDSAS
jgi:hypothetical protein